MNEFYESIETLESLRVRVFLYNCNEPIKKIIDQAIERRKENFAILSIHYEKMREIEDS